MINIKEKKALKNFFNNNEKKMQQTIKKKIILNIILLLFSLIECQTSISELKQTDLCILSKNTTNNGQKIIKETRVLEEEEQQECTNKSEYKYQCGNDLCAIDKEKCQKFVNLKSAIEFIKYSQAYGKKIKQFEAFKQTLRYCFETAVETIQLKIFNQNQTRKKNYLKNSAFNNFSFSFKFIVLTNIIISCCFIT